MEVGCLFYFQAKDLLSAHYPNTLNRTSAKDVSQLDWQIHRLSSVLWLELSVVCVSNGMASPQHLEVY